MSNDLCFTSWYSTINKEIVSNIYEWFAEKFIALYAFDESKLQIKMNAIEDNVETKKITSKINYSNEVFDKIIENADFGPQKIRFKINEKDSSIKIVSKYVIKSETNTILSTNIRNMESKGTIKLIEFIIPFIEALIKGSTLIIDEFDASLHPEIVIGIIKVFINKDINKNGAQLIFNTHSPIYLNKNIFRRDEIYFVSKDPNNYESIIYKLSDIKVDGKVIRSDEEYMKNYLTGKYGALPYIDFEEIVYKILNEVTRVEEDI